MCVKSVAVPPYGPVKCRKNFSLLLDWLVWLRLMQGLKFLQTQRPFAAADTGLEAHKTDNVTKQGFMYPASPLPSHDQIPRLFTNISSKYTEY